MNYRKYLLLWVIVCIGGLLAACGGRGTEQQVQPVNLPTLFPSPTPEYGSPDLALQVATLFLNHWQEQDYNAMYELLSFSSQQATNFQSFQTYYENTRGVIRLDDFTYTILAEEQENFRVIKYVYDMTLNSSLIGTFTDPQRILTLVLEEPAQQWKVAWTSGTIFAEMAGGGLLRMDTFTPRRANIYDLNGEILADMNGYMVTVSVIRGEIPYIEACINTLAQVFEKTPEQIQAQVNTFGLDQLAEVGVIEPAVYQEKRSVLETDCAVKFDNRPTRRYIRGDLMPHVIGYVGYPSEEDLPAIEAEGFRQDSIVGRPGSGIEGSWDETLRGKPGGRLSVVSPDGELLRLIAEGGSQPAQSVYLTIDIDLQRVALKALVDAYAAAKDGWARGSAGASLVMIDVNTGAVLALVSYPTFDANAFTVFPAMGETEAHRIVQEVQNNPRQPLLNRVTQGSYPTGSTMKVVTAIGALQSGAFRLDEKYVSVGIWNRDIPRVDWLGGGHGSVTISDALAVSCNTCFYEAGYRMNEIDPWILPNTATMMGLGQSTGLTDLPEDIGLIGNPDNKQSYEPTGVPWNFSDAVNIAIGQGGVKVSPLQLLRVYAAVANGGAFYRPQLVDRVGLLDEFSYTMTPELMNTVTIRAEVLDSIRYGLCRVTTASYGTAEFVFRKSRLQEIGVCGKTGTATSAGQDTQPHAWFVGYAPRDNPQVAVMVMIENGGQGSEVAAPIVRDVMEYYFFGEETP